VIVWQPCTLIWTHPAAATLDMLTARDPRMAERIHAALGDYVLTGRGDVRPLHDRPEWRLRVGPWRVLFLLDTTRREVLVRALANRRDVYRP